MVREDLVEAGTSKIHGRGLFARAAIEEGTLVGIYTGSSGRRWTGSPYGIHSYDDDGEWVSCVVGTTVLKLINHSTEPNVEIDAEFRVWTTKDVDAGDELTWYYGDEFQGQLERSLPLVS